jgi:hypothetical protein
MIDQSYLSVKGLGRNGQFNAPGGNTGIENFYPTRRTVLVIGV